MVCERNPWEKLATSHIPARKEIVEKVCRALAPSDYESLQISKRGHRRCGYWRGKKCSSSSVVADPQLDILDRQRVRRAFVRGSDEQAQLVQAAVHGGNRRFCF